MTRVAVDAMGGDNAPAEIVKGAVWANKAGCEVLLVGQPEVIQRELAANGATASASLRIVEANEVVLMDEAPANAVRRKRNSSLVICVDLVKRGEAEAAVSAGNSGAMMAAALMTLGRIPGIERPAIAAVMPVPTGGEIVIVDAGANVDCSAGNLLQFGLMGSLYSEAALGVAKPRVGLLSIGEEAVKGNALTKEAFPMLSAAPICFVGNVEGRDVFTGHVDVIVCDGFVGNVTLKTAEGTAEMMTVVMKREFQMNLWRNVLGALNARMLRDMKRKTSPDEYGGAPLLGVNGVCIISHGRSNATAISNAIREADKAVKTRVVDRIRAAACASEERG